MRWAGSMRAGSSAWNRTTEDGQQRTDDKQSVDERQEVFHYLPSVICRLSSGIAMTDSSEPSLAADFPAATREDWLKLVTAALKGAPIDMKLVSKTHDGLRIEPLYDRTASARLMTARAPAAPWQVLQRVDHPDPAAASLEARHDLANGATGLSLV